MNFGLASTASADKYAAFQMATPCLYELLSKGKKVMKVTIAHSIFQICGDTEMIKIALVPNFA